MLSKRRLQKNAQLQGINSKLPGKINYELYSEHVRIRGIGAFPLQRRHYYLKNDEWKKVATTLWVQVAQGEYVAPETLEEIYSKSNFIAQV
jgi:hypothetical protein